METLFERPTGGEQALLVHIDFTQRVDNEDFAEFQELVRAAGAQIIDCVTGKRDQIDPRYFMGRGKAEHIAQQVHSDGIQLVIVNHALSPSQERNLEQTFKCRVLDRTGLILDIFAQRAQSFEGKLQVELAQLNHLSTRLVRGWTHLERQKGGIGLRGPGETQLETDRRLLRARVKTILRRLEKVQAQRALSRRARQKAALPTISLVGYTNAGKSTLFNLLCESHVYVADKLFATLDPTLRRLQIPGIGTVILVDTVGFVRHLPHQLVEAFSATLEETRDADVLLHVIDASDPLRKEKTAQVNEVLTQIHAQDVLQIEVFNKTDKLAPTETVTPLPGSATQKPRVAFSAKTGEGMAGLQQAIVQILSAELFAGQVRLPAAHSGVRAALYAQSAIIDEVTHETGEMTLQIQIRHARLRQILAKAGLKLEDVLEV